LVGVALMLSPRVSSNKAARGRAEIGLILVSQLPMRNPDEERQRVQFPGDAERPVPNARRYLQAHLKATATHGSMATIPPSQ
jgi:hypothetical protein